jgi:hypothetical protein
MMSERLTRLPAAALAAFGLGLVACPLPFILRGALGQFSSMFSMVTLPPFVAAGAFLLSRHLAAGGAPTPSRHPALLALLEILSWIVVVAFVAVLSRISLLTPFERAGAVCLSLLLTAGLFLPIVLWRRTALERRIAHLPAAVVSGVASLLWLATAAVALALAYLSAPSSFIGRPRRHVQPVGLLDARPSIRRRT